MNRSHISNARCVGTSRSRSGCRPKGRRFAAASSVLVGASPTSPTNAHVVKKESGGLAAAASETSFSARLELAEQTQHGLGLSIRNAQSLGCSLAEDLTASQVSGFSGEVGIADHRLSSGRVLERHAEAVD